MKENLKLAIILAVIVGTCTALLAFTHAITKDPIENTRIENERNAMKEVMASATDFEKIDIVSPDSNSTILEINKAVNGSETVGYTFSVNTKGYGGFVNFLVGIDESSNLTGMKVLTHGETPGLGANSATEDFQSQFVDKPTENGISYVKGGEPKENEISAITGATITTEAITTGINDAINYYNENLKGR